MTSTAVGSKSTYSPPAVEGHRAAVIASFLGWTLDAFDFFLVSLSLTAIAKEFGQTDKAVAFSLSLTLMFRPVGAIIFGLMADRYGRKIPLMVNLVFYSAMAFATGLTTTFTSFLVVRALFGIGMGGEWGVGASLAMEKAPTKRRGLFSGLLQEGYACGFLLASLCFWFVFPRWGWRPMFFIGGLPALLAVYVRSQVKESEVWQRNRHTDWGSYGRTVVSHWKLYLYLVVLMSLMAFVAHGTQDMYPTFLQRDWGFTPQKRSALTAFSMVGAILGGLVFGHFSDRLGRRHSIVLALGLGVLVIPLWAYAPNLPLLVVGAFAMQFMVQGAWGVIPAHINELSPSSARGFLSGFAYQCGAAISASVVYIEAAYAERMPYARAMAMVAAMVFTLAAITAWFGKEKTGIEFT